MEEISTLDQLLKIEKKENVEKLEDNSSRGRFKGAEWFINPITQVTVGGAGGIGSWFLILATRALEKATFHVFDYDIIENHNLSGQFFTLNDVNNFKTQAINHHCINFSDKALNLYNEYTSGIVQPSQIMVACFDNMSARKLMFQEWKKGIEASLNTNKKDWLFIDGRLLAEQYEIFFVTKENMDEYEKDWLFKDDEIEDVACTLKQTSHFAALIAGNMVQGLTHHAANMNKSGSRELPFHITYYGELFLSKNYDTYTKDKKQK